MNPTRSPIRVLLIEDAETDALLVEAALEESPRVPFVMTHVETLEEARAKLREGSFDAVLLDLSLPDNLGLAGLEELHRSYPSLPILALTGWPDKSNACKALQAGAIEYLVKGQTPAPLLQSAIIQSLRPPGTAAT